jgi:MbtH protein
MSTEPNRPPRGEKGVDETTDDGRRYTVIVNCEGQYSIWLAGRTVPAGWRPAGPDGTRAECRAYVAKVWIDITPRSVRGREKR